MTLTRWIAAAIVVALYALLCGAVWRTERRRRRRAADEAAALSGEAGHPAGTLLIVHASQTGNAERLAGQTAQALRGAGFALRVEALGRLDAADLADAHTALFVVATAGEGDAPDEASTFVRRCMSAAVAADRLAGLRIGLLALGDREFANYCAFGRRLDDWLQAHGARALFTRIEVDGQDADALHRWQHELGRLASLGEAVDWAPPPPRRWRLAARRHLNPGSEGGPVFLVDLEPADAAPAAWESGDLLQVHLPGGVARPREYSIASLPADGRVQLLVRRERRADGTPGLASGWLTDALAVGDELLAGLLPHPNFRLGANAARPLILVGNGTGLAGLRGHLAARRASTTTGVMRNWLVFGERHAAHDVHCRADIEAWRVDGTLARVDLAFSRDPPTKVYVQDKLRAAAADVRAWVDDGAAIYVCGSLEGMATGVEDALVEILGRAQMEALVDAGRYRRDVY